MALPASGTITMLQIRNELSDSGAISLNDANVRGLLGKASGVISMSDGHGKSSGVTINLTLGSNVTNYNVRTAMIAAGWDQVTPATVTVTINSGVSVYSTSTGIYAFNTGTTFPSGTTLALINNGTIVGKGGAGKFGNVTLTSNGLKGGSAGPGFYAGYAISVTNNGRISGGGGGGGSGAYGA